MIKKINVWMRSLKPYIKITGRSRPAPLRKIDFYIISIIKKMLQRYYFMSYHIIDLIRNEENGKNRVNDIGIEYRDQYYQTIKYIDKPTFICPSCNFKTTSTESFEECSKCYDYNVNKTVEDIEFACKDYTFDVQSFEDVDCYDNAELCKIKVSTMFGIALFGIRYEPNSWSSTPHDDYIIKIFLFNTDKKRDQVYDQYKDQLIHDKTNFDIAPDS